MKFRFVDKILRYKENEYIEGLKAVSLEEYLLLRQIDVKEGFPETLMIEAIFQLGNFLIYKSFHNKLALLTMFDKINVQHSLAPGDVMSMRVNIVSVIDDSVRLNGAGYVNETEVITGEGCIGRLVDIETLYDPDAYAALFENLYRQNAVM